MPDQLVRQRSADPLQQDRVGGVLEDAPVPLSLDVLEVIARRALRRVRLAHVAESPRELRQPLAVGAVAEPVDRQMVRRGERGPREEGNLGLVVEASHASSIVSRSSAYARSRSTRSRTRRAAGGSGASSGSYFTAPSNGDRTASVGTLTPGFRIPVGSKLSL